MNLSRLCESLMHCDRMAVDLAKVRGHEQDVSDARAAVYAARHQARALLIRYPAANDEAEAAA